MIGNVVQSGSWIYIYDEKGKRKGSAITAINRKRLIFALSNSF